MTNEYFDLLEECTDAKARLEEEEEANAELLAVLKRAQLFIANGPSHELSEEISAAIAKHERKHP